MAVDLASAVVGPFIRPPVDLGPDTDVAPGLDLDLDTDLGPAAMNADDNTPQPTGKHNRGDLAARRR